MSLMTTAVIEPGSGNASPVRHGYSLAFFWNAPVTVDSLQVGN